MWRPGYVTVAIQISSPLCHYATAPSGKGGINGSDHKYYMHSVCFTTNDSLIFKICRETEENDGVLVVQYLSVTLGRKMKKLQNIKLIIIAHAR